MKKDRFTFICVTGIDGSGKTTLARKICESLKNEKFDAVYVYARIQPFISKPLMFVGNFLFLKNNNMQRDYDSSTVRKNDLFKKHSLISSFYVIILLFDDLLHLLWKIYFPLLKGKIVICDRYIYDTIITDLSVDMQLPLNRISLIFKKCFLFLPQPSITFLIDLPEEIAYSRKNDISDIKYLKDRRKLYLKIGQEYNMSILDGTKNIDEIFVDAKKRLNDVLNI